MSVAQGQKILASDVQSTNNPNTIVLRDSSGGFATEKIALGTTSYGVALPANGTSGQLFFQISDPWYELPAGGTAGQVLVKASNDNRDVAWADGGAGGGSNIDFDSVYPVGSIYLTTAATSPADLFGGTWVQIKDKFLLAVGDTYKPVKSTGGQVSLTANNLPNHTHTMGTESSDHSHQVPATSSAFGGGRVTFPFNTESGSGNYREMSWSYGRSAAHTHTINSSGGKDPPDPFLPPYITVYVWERTA